MTDIEEKPIEAPAEETVTETAPDAAKGDESKENIVVTIGDEPAPEAEEHENAPVWVKKVRQRNRELEKELRETRKQLQTVTATKEPQVSKKPTLKDYDYDTEKYEAALIPWYEQDRKAKEEAARAEKDWNARLEAYQSAKAEFKADDYDEVEAAVFELLDQTQQGIIVHGASDPALLFYALGKNEAKAKELAAIKDPVKYAFALAKLEATLKVSTKKPATQPEGRISGNASPSGTVDSTLERLREEASKTGDYSKVVAYKRSKQKT